MLTDRDQISYCNVLYRVQVFCSQLHPHWGIVQARPFSLAHQVWGLYMQLLANDFLHFRNSTIDQFRRPALFLAVHLFTYHWAIPLSLVTIPLGLGSLRQFYSQANSLLWKGFQYDMQKIAFTLFLFFTPMVWIEATTHSQHGRFSVATGPDIFKRATSSSTTHRSHQRPASPKLKVSVAKKKYLQVLDHSLQYVLFFQPLTASLLAKTKAKSPGIAAQENTTVQTTDSDKDMWGFHTFPQAWISIVNESYLVST